MVGRRAAGIDDCLANVRRVVERFRVLAARRGVARLASGGSSAGAHLALLATMTAPERPVPATGPDVAAVVAFNPAGTDLLALPPDVRRDLERNAGIAPGRASAYSLIEFVRPGHPPTLVHHGTADGIEPIGHVRRFRDAMARAGNHRTLIEYEHAEHAFHHPGHGTHFDDVIDATVRFLLSPRARHAHPEGSGGEPDYAAAQTYRISRPPT